MVAINSASSMFARFNSNQTENAKHQQILDSNEIAKAKQAGFNFFNLSVNMTENEFTEIYGKYASAQENQVEFEQRERAIHVKYLQMQYGSSEPIGEEESISDYEERLKNNITKSDAEQPSSITPIKPDISV